MVGSGSLSQTTTYSPTTSVWTGDGSAVTSATLNGNHIEQKAAASSGSGTLSMSYSMAGQGILQANLNTGAAAVQGNSVALTSNVGGSGGGLSGFSPTLASSPR